MSKNELKNKIIANLKKPNHTIILDSEEHAAIYEVDLDTLNRTVHQLVDESTLVARSNEEFWGVDIGGGDEILCRLGETYFTFSGGGMGAEVIESCTKAEADKLLTKWTSKI
jgi:hypothetical protein